MTQGSMLKSISVKLTLGLRPDMDREAPHYPGLGWSPVAGLAQDRWQQQFQRGACGGSSGMGRGSSSSLGRWIQHKQCLQ